jgi:hypothetical protein
MVLLTIPTFQMLFHNVPAGLSVRPGRVYEADG